MNALFIGRFQPFHKGHLKVLQSISVQYENIIIGVGSSQYHDTLDNPFSFEERKQMISQSLESVGICNFQVVSIPDIHNPPKWVAHVRSIIPNFDIVITNNAFTKELFVEKGYQVKDTGFFDKVRFSGKEIRRRIKDDESWEDLVPIPVAILLNAIDGVDRIKKKSS